MTAPVDYASKAVKLEDTMFLELCKSTNTPYSLAASLRHQDGQELIAPNPLLYVDGYKFAKDYAVYSLIRKSQRDLVGVDRRASAVALYMEMEQHCSKTNMRLTSRDQQGETWIDSLTSHELSMIRSARAWIKRILGPLTKAKLNFAYENSGYSQGATTSVKGKDRVNYTTKYGFRSVDATTDVAQMAPFILSRSESAMIDEINVIACTRLTTVPKDSKIDRCIEVQPDLNLFFQKGIGKLIRSRLIRAGFDVDSVQKNVDLAREGSINNLWTTLDLSSASDTIAREAVKRLLPREWFEFLALFRTTHIEVDGVSHELEKFSAMGNGYTWELETLLFTGILLAASDGGDVIAYGDDMVFETKYRDNVQLLLNLFGFIVNDLKTYSNTCFRESCGSDFWLGVNIRPAFLNAEHINERQAFVSICHNYANKLSDWGTRLGLGSCRDSVALGSWLLAYKACPNEHRYRVPYGYSGGFYSTHAEIISASSSPPSFGRTWCGVWFKSLRPVLVPVQEDRMGWLRATYNGHNDGKSSEQKGTESVPTGRLLTRKGFAPSGQLFTVKDWS